MQSPAKPYGCRGLVTAAKYIGLESLRVRNCDPGADNRLPIDRASRRWNDDFELDCHWSDQCPAGSDWPCQYPAGCQSAGLRAPGWQAVTLHDSVRRSPSRDGVESQNADDSPVADATRGNCPGPCDSARHRLLTRLSSCPPADSGSTDTQHAVHPFGLVCASGRIAPSFVLFRPFLFPEIAIETPQIEASQLDEERLSGLRSMTRNVVARTCSRNGQRTHSLTRVSNEKRNADECPPTRGKSNCHR